MIRPALLIFYFILTVNAAAQLKAEQISSQQNLYTGDWLIKPVTQKAGIYSSADKKDIILYNGLVKRTFRLSPNVVCTDYKNMITGQQLLRAVMPEAVITINGKEYNIGGLYGQKEKAYLLPEWLENFTKGENDFQFVSYEINELKPFIAWKAGSWWASNKKHPAGKVISFSYRNNLPGLKDVVINVHYALYDGLPLIAKWVTVENKGTIPFKIDRVKNEVLAMVEEESAVVGKAEVMKKQQGIYVETNYAFNNAMRYDISDQTLHWKTDSSYTSQVNYNYTTPCVLEVYPDKAPGIELQAGRNLHLRSQF